MALTNDLVRRVGSVSECTASLRGQPRSIRNPRHRPLRNDPLRLCPTVSGRSERAALACHPHGGTWAQIGTTGFVACWAVWGGAHLAGGQVNAAAGVIRVAGRVNTRERRHTLPLVCRSC